MRRYRGQRGEGQGGCIFGLLLLLLGAFVAYKMIPVKVKAAELRQVVFDEAKMAGTRSDQRIAAAILKKAEDLKLPVKEGNVKVDRHATSIDVDVQYVVPVEFPGYTYNWKFHHHAANPIF